MPHKAKTEQQLIEPPLPHQRQPAMHPKARLDHPHNWLLLFRKWFFLLGLDFEIRPYRFRERVVVMWVRVLVPILPCLSLPDPPLDTGGQVAVVAVEVKVEARAQAQVRVHLGRITARDVAHDRVQRLGDRHGDVVLVMLGRGRRWVWCGC